jgi:outer membrane protein assembly factor BamB
MTLGYDVETSDGLEVKEAQSSAGNGGLMDSAWPMYCHDVRHTGRSPYGKDGNFGIVKWKFRLPDADSLIDSSPAIDKNGTIYIGFQPDSSVDTFYAIYSNGTKKWSYDCDMVQSSPAIAEDGTVYVGSNDGLLYAFYPNGTKKWRLQIGSGWVYSSPVIDQNGIIYVASVNGQNICAVYPDGTKKWNFKTGSLIYDSPALDENGIVFIGSNDCYLYAIYTNNGTLKWKFKTDGKIGCAPTIGDDGIIYFGSNDAHLYALYPNGTLKWKFSVRWDALTSSPALDDDGNIYFGCHAGYIYCLDSDGNEKWRYPTFSSRWDAEVSAPVAIDNNGIIYAGDWDGTFYALNPDGTARWKFKTDDAIFCSPVIGEDGTIYVASWDGYLYALEIVEIDNEPPLKPTVDGPTRGIPRINYKFTATTMDPDGDNVSYFFDWGDDENSGWTGFVPSGTSINRKHTWYDWGTYTVKVKAQDEYGADSQWATLKVNPPRNRAIVNSLFLWFLERFPILSRLLYLLK